MSQHRRPHRHRDAVVFPPAPPVDRVLADLGKLEEFMLRHNDRELAREHNGSPSGERDPERVARRDAALTDLGRQCAELDQVPPVDRVPEYRATPSTSR